MTALLRGATIALYNDSPVFGGNEEMTVVMANELGEHTAAEVHLFHHHRRFAGRARPDVRLHPLRIRTEVPFPFLRNLNPAHVLAVHRRLRRVRPDLLLVAQGNIEFGLKGLLAGRTLGIPTASRLPLAVTFREAGSRFAPLRDAVNRVYYRLPDAFLVVADYQAELLHRFTTSPTWTVRSPIERAQHTSQPRLPIRSDGRLELAIVGRVNFRHKNHPALVEAARRLQDRGRPPFRVHVAGDGPDLSRLRELVRAQGLRREFVFHGWLGRQEVLALLRDRVHLVVIPSHFEGVPLIMLEAAATATPFLVSRLPFAIDYAIPETFLFTPTRPDELARKIAAAAEGFDREAFLSLRDRILDHHAPRRFRIDLLRAVGALLEAS